MAMNKTLARFKERFHNDIGIDLGTANTLVYVKGRGIVINEPSVVAVNQKTGKVVAFGGDARKMLGRTPAHITAIRPLVDGVVSNFEVTVEMLSYFIKKIERTNQKLLRPRVIVGVPYGITNVERRAVMDAARAAGAREVFVIEQPVSAALGIRLPIHEPVGNMVIDIGGGTTDIAVMSLSGIVRAKSLRIAGDTLNQNIIAYIKEEFKILLGERTAEDLKILVGSVHPGDEPREATVRGRDLITGLPREVVITGSDIKEAITPSINTFIEAVKEVIETTPPEIVSDIMHRGIVLVGGGSLIHGLPELLLRELKIPIHITDDALSEVVRGMGVVLEDLDLHKDMLIENEDELPPVI